MDWVEKRAGQEKLIKEAANMLWPHLCAELEHAVRSFNKHYPGYGLAEYRQAHSDQVIAARNTLGATRWVKVILGADQMKVGIQRDPSKPHQDILHFEIADGEKVAFVNATGAHFDVEQACKFILEPVLFDNSR